MANVFRSKEVYKHLKHDVYGKNTIVPVKGVYISGEYRPPYYNESGIRIYEISGQNCNIVDYKDETVETKPIQTAIMHEFELTDSVYTIQRYTSNSVELGTAQTAGMYKLDLSETSYNIQRFEKDYTDTSSIQTSGMYKIDVTSTNCEKTIQEIKRNNSTPEPMLRLSLLTSEHCTITNYTS